MHFAFARVSRSQLYSFFLFLFSDSHYGRKSNVTTKTRDEFFFFFQLDVLKLLSIARNYEGKGKMKRFFFFFWN